MAKLGTVILSAGGLRSLVATAVTLSGGADQAAKVALLFFADGRPTAARRREHVRRQAQHFGITQVLEIEAPHLQDPPSLEPNRPAPPPALVRPQVLLAGVAHAVQVGAAQLIWPAQANGQFAAVSRASEQVVLVQHLAQLEAAELPAIRTPLLELTDQQVIELGGKLEVPWHLAWTCQTLGDRPCRLCPACRSRRQAFDAARVEDPVEQLAR
jgi:7-cyano-7-deazaguanine synthase